MSTTRRYLFFIAAVIVQSSGIALLVKSMLGTAPISSLPYVLSLSFSYSLGTMTFAINMLMFMGQILILRRKFEVYQLMQIPVTILFSYFIDVFMVFWNWVEPTSYPLQMVALLVGTALIALGIAVQGIAQVLMLPGEGLVYVVARYFHFDFGKVKTANDVSIVCLAMMVSFVYRNGIEGIREGTLISALITGTIARFFLKHLSVVDEKGALVFKPHW